MANTQVELKDLKQKMAQNDYCVIGMGRFGSEVAKYLLSKGKKVLVIDSNEKVVRNFQQEFEYAVVADATNVKVLEELGIWKVNAVIVCVSNVESSAIICSNLRGMNVKHIVARAKNVLHKKILTLLGIDYTVIPENIVGRQLGFRAIYDVDTDLVNINEKVVLLNVIVTNDDIVDKPIKNLNFRDVGINIITIDREGEIIFPISAETNLAIGDSICVVCRVEKTSEAVKIFSNIRR